MDKWIYFKSNNPADALALVTILATSKEKYNIVRRSNISQFFNGLENVTIDFYHPQENHDIIILDEINTDSWMEKCDVYASVLNIDIKDDYTPYYGFTEHIDEIDKRLNYQSMFLLYLFPCPEQNLDLFCIDRLVRLLEKQGVKGISGGTSMMPCIKRTLDLRQVISYSVLCSLLSKVLFVITTEKSIATICEAFHKKVFVLNSATL